uniref:GTP cyclohydrolase 1 n=1 Tax=Cajanus cajan TaxID=3821 RepID=A0A151QY87_CAJCA|nr:GTP cyclohydrolase 1 [Cajanus cajan]
MGHLGQKSLNYVLENGVSVCCDEECFEKDTIPASIQCAVQVLLMGLGEDINREGIIKTPHRVAKALHEGTIGYGLSAKEIVEGALFPEAGVEGTKVGHAGGVGGLVMVRDLDFYSYCESCMLPFYLKCHVGYVPSGQRVLGLSKLSRSIVHFFGFKLQVQERLTKQIAETVSPLVGGNVIVVVEAGHTCMISRGIEKFGSNTATIAALGLFATDLAARTSFLQSIPRATYIS